MRRIKHTVVNLLREIKNGESGNSAHQAGVRKLRYLHSDESGLLSMSNLIVVLIMLTMTTYVGNVVYETKQKLEIQNAADTVAYSTSVWMARGMNAITTTNHLVGELTAICVIHDAISGPEADHYDMWKMTQEHETINGTIKPLRITAPITNLSKFPYFTTQVRDAFDEDFTCYVTKVMTKNYFPIGPQKDTVGLVSGAMIYDAKMTLKKKSVSYLVAKSGANLFFFVPPWIGWVPAGYIAAGIGYGIHFYCNTQLLELLAEWHTLDTLGYMARKVSRLKKPIETKLIPMLSGYTHFVATGNTSLPGKTKASKKQNKTTSPIQGAVRSTGEVLRDELGIDEVTTFPPPSKLYLPVTREPEPGLSNLKGMDIWGKAVPVNLSKDFLKGLADQLAQRKQKDPRKRVREKRRAIVIKLRDANKKFEDNLSDAKKSNEDSRKNLEKLDGEEELTDDDKDDLNDEIEEFDGDTKDFIKDAKTGQSTRDEAIKELYATVTPQEPKNKMPDGINFDTLTEEAAKQIKGEVLDVAEDTFSNLKYKGVACDDGDINANSSFDTNQIGMESFMDPKQLQDEIDWLTTDHRVTKEVLRQMDRNNNDYQKSKNEKKPEDENPDEDKEPKTTANDPVIEKLEEGRTKNLEMLRKTVVKMEKKLQKLRGQLEKTKAKPDFDLHTDTGSNVSHENLIKIGGFDADIEKYSQFGRASYPYIEGYRAPFLKNFKQSSNVSLAGIKDIFSGNFNLRMGLKQSGASKHFVKWTNRYGLAKIHQLRTGHRWKKMFNSKRVEKPKLDFFNDPKLKPAFLYEMDSGNRKNPNLVDRHKGTEIWTGFKAKSAGQLTKSKRAAEDRFSVVGFAYRKPHQPFFYKVLFRSPNTKGKMCMAQAMFYNGNAQVPFQDASPQKLQPAIGWDTLNWKDVKDGKSYKSLAPEFPPGLPAKWGTSAKSSSEHDNLFKIFFPGEDFSDKVCKTHINWQAKLAPVTRRRLQQAADEKTNALDFDGYYGQLVEFAARAENVQIINH